MSFKQACEHLLSAVCCALLQEESAISKWCAFDLFLSQDFARTWKNLTAESGGRIASFWDFEWGASLERRKVQPLPLLPSSSLGCALPQQSSHTVLCCCGASKHKGDTCLQDAVAENLTAHNLPHPLHPAG